MDGKELKLARKFLEGNWGLRLMPGDGMGEIRLALKLQIHTMLIQDFEGLVQTMYRLDVAEAKFKEALDLRDIGLMADELATIVLDREFQRVETWMRFKARDGEQ